MTFVMLMILKRHPWTGTKWDDFVLGLALVFDACAVMALLMLLMAKLAGAHEIGDPALENTAAFKKCCHERDCRPYRMRLLQRGAEWSAVRFYEQDGVVDAWVRSESIKREVSSKGPVLCTLWSAPPVFMNRHADGGLVLGNGVCLFFPNPGGAN